MTAGAGECAGLANVLDSAGNILQVSHCYYWNENSSLPFWEAPIPTSHSCVVLKQ